MNKRKTLSILIPARNEQFLSRTVEDLLSNIRADTEIVVIADGNWPYPPIKDDPRVHLIYHSESVGQRAATNEAAKISRAKYLMKVDAHTSFDEGFDQKMMDAMQDDWTMVPIMRNLHVFDWVCEDGHRRYQGPSGPCKECGKPTKMDVVWIAKTNPQSTSYCFDPEPHFQYFNEVKKRPEYRKAAKETGLTETMSLQGSCFMVTKEKYFELELSDEAFGSWGSQGLEVAIKTWTSGGRVVCNHKTFYAHAFRTQGGDWGFPYPISGRQVEHAKKRAKDIFFKSQWGPQQIRPLSWLVEKFWPMSHWKEQDLRDLKTTEATVFPPVSSININPALVGKVVVSLVDRSADGATPGFPINLCGENVPVTTMGLATIDGPDSSVGFKHVVAMKNEFHVKRETTTGIITNNMMKFGDLHAPSTIGKGSDKPSIHQAVSKANTLLKPDIPVTKIIPGTDPYPASGYGINLNSGKEMTNEISGQSEGFCEKFTVSHRSSSSDDLGSGLGECLPHSPGSSILPRHRIPVKAFVYYTDNRPDPKIMQAVQRQLLKCANGHKIVSVSLHKPVDFGENITVEMNRGYLTMFKQILMGIEACDADIIFLVEHDVLYHQSHFSFVPPRKDMFYYDENRWFVDAATGRALFYNAMSTSMMCAYRDLLLEHYRKRVERVEREGYSFRIGFEPGGHKFPRGIDNYTREAYFSEFPSIDIRHSRNLTVSRWDQSEFRNKKNLYAWKESDEIPGWGVVKGRFQEILDAI